MASGRIIFPGFMPCEDSNGDRIAGAKAYFYLNLTATLTTVYSDSALTIPHTNPAVADADGVWPAMWADTTLLFTVSLTDGSGVPLAGATWSGVGPAIDGTLASVALAASAQIAAQTAQAAAEVAEAGAEAAEAQAAAIAAELSGAPFSATSITSLLIGTGAKSLVLTTTGKLFTVGQTVVIARTSAPTTQMTGVITAFNSATGAMTVSVSTASGSGTFTDWSISLSSAGGVTSIAGLTGIVTGAAAKAALAIAEADIVDLHAVVGRHEIWVPAVAMIARTTNGGAVGAVETITNKIMLRSLDFDAATIEYAQFMLRMPKSWNEGTVTAIFEWSHAATTTNFKVSWGLQAVALSDNDAGDAAPGTAQFSNDTGGTTNTLYASPETAAITIAGTPAANDLVVFQVLRKADDGTNDTLAIDARLHGLTLILTTDAGNDA